MPPQPACCWLFTRTTAAAAIRKTTIFSGLLLYSPVAVGLKGRGEPRMLTAHLPAAPQGVEFVAGRQPDAAFLPEEDAGTAGPASR
jgi:hypothetical protein